MPLPFPKTTVRDRIIANARYLEKEEGHPREVASAIAFAEARKHWFKKYPHGLLPPWLTYRRDMRAAKCYTETGAPLRGNPIKSGAVREASRLYRGFTGDAPDLDIDANIPKAQFAVGIIVGDLLGLEIETRDQTGTMTFDRGNYPALIVSANGRKASFSGGDFAPVLKKGLDKVKITAIMYRTVRDGKVENYRHPFAKFAQPALSVIDARNAKMSGGSFRFTDRGFVDSR